MFLPISSIPPRGIILMGELLLEKLKIDILLLNFNYYDIIF